MALPQSLNYLDVQRRAAASRSFRSKLASSNGISFQMQDEIVFDLPGNVQNSFYDMNSMYVEYTVTNGDGNDVAFDGGAGAYSMWNRVNMSSAGATISNLTGFSNLANCLFDSQVGTNYSRNVAHNMLGTSLEGKSYVGATIAAGTSRKVCMPLIAIAPCLTTPSRFWPAMSRDRCQLRISLNDAATAFFHTAAGLLDADISITDVNLVFYTIELQPQVMAQIAAMTQNRYELLCGDYIHASSSVAKGASAHTATLGFSAGSLEAITVSHRCSDNISNVTRHSFTRSSSNLSQYQLSVNNNLYPSRPLLVDAVSKAEAMAELQLSKHALKNFNEPANFNSNGTALVDYYNVSDASGVVPGSFLTAIELESFAGSDKVYAGINTTAATVQLQLEYNNTQDSVTNVPQNTTIDIYGLRTIKVVLDMAAGGVFEVFV